MIGTVVGNYRILARLAEGGMGEIYTAQHQLIGRMAAVKVLHPQLTANKDVVNRFFNEARATTAINHPGIVEVFDFGHLDSGHAYLVMELLEGMTLTQWRRARGPISEGEAAMILRSVCSALMAAHGKGIVHRDLKPDNIFMVHDAESPLGFRTKLLDFGIAKLTDATGMGANATSTGAVMGTPTYMSPEQCRGTGSVDHRADLYSLGCIYYQLLSGRPPFDHAGAGELIGAHLFMQPDPISAHVGGVSPDVVALIANLLQKQPEHRLQSARDLAGALAHIAQRTGWLPITSEVDVRLSVPNLLAPPADRPTAIAGDRGSYPSYPSHPSHSQTGPGTPPGTSPNAAGAPTTLSGAASQSSVITGAPIAPKKRRGFALPLAIGSVLAVGVVIAVVATRGPRGDVGAASAPAVETGKTTSTTTDGNATAGKSTTGGTTAADGAAVDKTTDNATVDGKTTDSNTATVDGKTAGTDGKTVVTTGTDGTTVGTDGTTGTDSKTAGIDGKEGTDSKTETDGKTAGADGKTAGADGKTVGTTGTKTIGTKTTGTKTTGTKTTGTKTTGTKTTGTKTTGTKTTGTKKPEELIETDL